MTRLTQIEAIPMMSAAINPTKRREEAIAAKQKNVNGYPWEIKTPTRRIPLEIFPPFYPNARIN